MAKSKSKGPRKATKTSRARTAARKPAPRRRAAKATAKRAPRRTPTAARARGGDAMQALAQRIVDVTVGHDDDATLALYADDVESTEMGQPAMRGIDAIRQKFQMWRGMTSHASFRPKSVLVDGNAIVIEWVGTVTLSSSGKTVTLDEVAVHEIRNGKIVRERFYYDPSQLRP
ncbi:MAG TPA: nuclear transport factor 2 family protein [Candidatus Binatia bacterium]